MNELFTEKKWLGVFFAPDQYEKRFSGQIDYSPEHGVILSYLLTEHEKLAESNLVYGVLESGDRCTLVGKFTPKYAGHSIKDGLSTRSGRAGFSCLLVGDFIAQDELFKKIYFSLTNLQEFFFPKGYKDLVKFSDKPLFILKTTYGELEVGNSASFNSLPKDITAQIYSRNADALKELKELFDALEAKHPDSHFMLKKDIAYRIRLKIDAGATVIGAYERISEIADLFAILIYGPVYPENVQILKKVEDGHTLTIDVYPSLALNKRTMELCTEDRSHFHMPITKSNIDLSAIIQSWLANPKSHTTIVSSIQNETGFRDVHSLHGELVLYATQLESISHSMGIKNDQKYDHPLSTFGSENIRKGIGAIFVKSGEADIGKAISDLRNEIAHVGKPKKLLLSLSMQDMITISQYLQMTIIGYILESLGVKKEVINNYQDKFAPSASA